MKEINTTRHRLFALLLFGALLLGLCSCANTSVPNSSEDNGVVAVRTCNESLTEDQLTQITYTFADFAERLGDVFSSMGVMCQKYEKKH